MKWIAAFTIAAAATLAAQTSKPGDLDGVWAFSTLTPLERSAEFAGKPTLTPEEATAFEKRTIDRNDRDRRDGGSADADLGGAYNEFWWERGTRVANVRGRLMTSLVTDPPDGRIPELTRQAQLRAMERANDRRQHPADGPENRSLGERCLMFNAGPPMLPGPYNNYVQIFQMGRAVVILNEMIHDARIVPVDGSSHPPSAIRRWQGDSRGRWDGAALVVDTVGFAPGMLTRAVPHSEQLHVVERFWFDAKTRQLRREYTASDPRFLTEPVKGSNAMDMSGVRYDAERCEDLTIDKDADLGPRR